ncbi:MAG: hypothetical protein G01um101420_843 [Parcubacteria group bacterium Gr01-1014_20]|nr:MAG: hypothetical protein G01um101420_843 [Parcubacteria group bacterium Gr01-1014_20]
MFIDRGDGTVLSGPADTLCILRLPVGSYHVAFFEEKPMPGPVKPINELSIIRLKSKMHETNGHETLEGAKASLAELRKKFIVPDENVVDDVAFEVEDPVQVWVVENWIGKSLSLKNALGLPTVTA